MKVVILIGSKTDLDAGTQIKSVLEKFEIPSIIRIVSINRLPVKYYALLKDYEKENVVFISLDSSNNAISGICDALTNCPVITCIPVINEPNHSPNSFVTTIPSGISSMIVLSAESAAIEAAKILGLNNKNIKVKISDYLEKKRELIEDADNLLQKSQESQIMIIGDDIQLAANIIADGGLVAFPTETVYGLGANALNPIAVAKIFEAKQRPSFDPLIVHIHSINQINLLFASPICNWVEKLAEAFWPGPLTLVYYKADIVPHIVTSGLETVAVRMPSNATALSLIEKAGCPIAAPSANRFGQISPTKPEHVIKQLTDIDYVLVGEDVSLGIESTVLAVSDEGCCILRPGVITAEQIAKIVPLLDKNPFDDVTSLSSPGLLKSHYAPTKPMFLLEKDKVPFLPKNSGLILHDNKNYWGYANKIFVTSEKNDYKEIASNLFLAFHTMEDANEVEQIFIEPVTEEGIGIAIMDRIKKAVYKYK